VAKKTKPTVPVTMRALIQRINRKLSRDGGPSITLSHCSIVSRHHCACELDQRRRALRHLLRVVCLNHGGADAINHVLDPCTSVCCPTYSAIRPMSPQE
jgi:hypothetical protein